MEKEYVLTLSNKHRLDIKEFTDTDTLADYYHDKGFGEEARLQIVQDGTVLKYFGTNEKVKRFIDSVDKQTFQLKEEIAKASPKEIKAYSPEIRLFSIGVNLKINFKVPKSAIDDDVTLEDLAKYGRQDLYLVTVDNIGSKIETAFLEIIDAFDETQVIKKGSGEKALEILRKFLYPIIEDYDFSGEKISEESDGTID